MYGIGEHCVEAAKTRCGVLNCVVISLVESGIANTSQVAHVTDLITEEVGRTARHFERTIETSQLYGAKITCQTYECIASGEVGTVRISATGSEVDLLLHLEECFQVRIDLMITLETQARRVT